MVCLICNSEVVGHLNRKYCSDECRSKARRAQFKKSSRKRSKAESRRKAKASHTCQCCGLEYIRETGGYKYCSKKCRERECSNNGNGIRRARRQGKKEFGIVHFKEVFDRDLGLCCHCGNALLFVNRGINMDESPVIDHIKPLAIGGDHNLNNAQLLCRMCNTKKGASFGDRDLQKYLELNGDDNAAS